MEQRDTVADRFDFKRWLLKGSNGVAPGWKCLTPGWPWHLSVALSLPFAVQKNPSEIASSILLPLVGALIGLTFAWAGNANALLQTDEFQLVRRTAKVGIEEYVNYYQLVILIVLATCVGWGIVGLGPFGESKHYVWINRLALFPLFFLTSLAIRESYFVVDFARQKLIAREMVSEAKKDS